MQTEEKIYFRTQRKSSFANPVSRQDVK